MIRLLISILLIGILSGCAVTKTSVWYPDDKGVMKKVVEIEQDAPGAVTYKPDTKEITVDSRKSSWWQENVLPMIAGAVSTASRGR